MQSWKNYSVSMEDLISECMKKILLTGTFWAMQ